MFCKPFDISFLSGKLKRFKELSSIRNITKLFATLPFLMNVAPVSASELPTPTYPVVPAIEAAFKLVDKPQFPNMASNYQSMLTAQTDCTAQGGTFSITGCDIPPPPPPPPPAPVYVAPVYSGLIGQIGWSLSWGNCVDEPGVNNPGWGNPIDWPVTSYQPWIGASALFWFNHVAYVVGIWSNGDIEVAQENAPGFPHRIPPYMIRGYR